MIVLLLNVVKVFVDVFSLCKYFSNWERVLIFGGVFVFMVWWYIERVYVDLESGGIVRFWI